MLWTHAGQSAEEAASNMLGSFSSLSLSAGGQGGVASSSQGGGGTGPSAAPEVAAVSVSLWKAGAWQATDALPTSSQPTAHLSGPLPFVFWVQLDMQVFPSTALIRYQVHVLRYAWWRSLFARMLEDYWFVFLSLAQCDITGQQLEDCRHSVHRYLAHKTTPNPPGPPQDPRNGFTVGFQGAVVS